MPTTEEPEEYLFVGTQDLKIASDYSGLNFAELMKIDCVSYRILVRDAFIFNMKQTKEGREALKDSWYLEQTKPDKQALRKKYKEQ